MRVVLEITSGKFAGRKIALRARQVLHVGRTEQADYVIDYDSQLSSVHFVLESDFQICRIRDLGSRNGTFVNGNKISEAILNDGDELLAGQTRFSVHVELPEPLAVLAAAPALPVQAAVTPSPRPNASFFQRESGPIRSAPVRSLKIESSRPYEPALHDENQRVRGAALFAAAWTKQQWLLDHCRELAKNPVPKNWDAVLLLAILGKPFDLPQILSIGKTDALGPQRFRALGSYGHPAVVDSLIDQLASKNLRCAVSAGAAFSKITGADIESEDRVQLPPEDGSEPDEFEREFLDELKLPSLELAKVHWRRVKEQFTKGTRWCRGFNLSQGTSPEVLANLDLESRWEACLRGKFEGTWKGRLTDLEAFLQRRR